MRRGFRDTFRRVAEIEDRFGAYAKTLPPTCAPPTSSGWWP